MTALLSQEARDQSLLAVFASAARVAVIRVFMLDPLREYYQRQIEAATALPIRAVQRELERFTAIALLFKRVEGNRAYYQVDRDFPLFPELRGMILKAASPEARLRGALAMNDAVRLLFLNEASKRVLTVTASGRRLGPVEPGPFEIEMMSEEEFVRQLSEKNPTLEEYLLQGADLLGRREDVLWRRIEAAGYNVPRGKGVP